MKTYCIIIGLIISVLLSAQTPQELRDRLPEVPGWEIVDEIEVFDRDNLYNRINGAAPLYFENNFREMTSMEYVNGDRYITIQAYRHASPEGTFGMYASERSSDMTFYDGIGGEAQGDDYGLYFFAGIMYVKMLPGDDDEATLNAMRDIARGFSHNITPEGAAYPKLFEAFPTEGLIARSNAYITSNYIGHEFLKQVYTANYEIDGRKFQVFVIDGETGEGALAILNSYFNFTKQAITPSPEGFIIEDRYNGNIPALLKGQYIIGAFDENAGDFPNEIFEFLKTIELY